jgi:hypothetical protein
MPWFISSFHTDVWLQVCRFITWTSSTLFWICTNLQICIYSDWLKFFDILGKSCNTEYYFYLWRWYHSQWSYSIFNFFKAIKGVWWMPWLWEATKDVVSCDKLRGAAHKHYIRRFPNGTTQYTEGVLSERKPTLGTETSKYQEEKKTNVISWVVASEKEIAQTQAACCLGVVGPHLETVIKLNFLES